MPSAIERKTMTGTRNTAARAMTTVSADRNTGLGTLGLSATKAEDMARAAGFSRFRRLDIDHPINAFYEIRP